MRAARHGQVQFRRALRLASGRSGPLPDSVGDHPAPRGARSEAESSSRMQDEFLSTLSHELRTPLSAILGWAQVLQRGPRAPADVQRGLDSIERNARIQAQLIDELLDMNRISCGKVQLDMQSVAPAGIIRAVLAALRPAATAKNIRLETHLQADAAAVAGDPGRLQQALWNLLSNALKFTPRDGCVHVTLAQLAGHVEITVADTGVGIPAPFLKHVFERFRQADASTTRRHGGLGLGLSLVKLVVEQHGGTVRAASEGAGRGASFTLQLPLAPAGASSLRLARPFPLAPSPHVAELGLCDLSGVKVLLIDEEADARELIVQILHDSKAQVFATACAAEAMQLMLSERPDVLLSDSGRPGVDGFELLEQARALGPARGGDVPAIAMSCLSDAEARMHALDSGYRACVPNPVDAAELIATVAIMTGHNKR